MRKHKILLCFFILGSIEMKSQEDSNASGGDAVGSGGTAAYSVGQVIYTSISGTGSVNQGVQQPYTLIATGVNDHPDINLSMSVYPNPSTVFIILNIGKQDLKDISFLLFDVQGKLILKQKIINIETSIIMEEYNSGNYFLKVCDTSTELKTFKIIKN